MVDAADVEAAGSLLLEMALEAKALIAHLEHHVVDRAVRIMADGAAFAHGLVFENKRPALCNMAFQASVVLGMQSRSAAFDGWAFVRIMTIAAAHPGFRNRMVVWQFELPALVQVTLIAILRRPAGIDDGLTLAA